MSDDNFIARWSRRKREAENEKIRPKQPASPQASAEQQPASTAGEKRAEVEPPFDPATLPPIESIVADTDIRAFLQKGVPADLTKAALRRAWSTDPAIRNFIEMAENQWDFTDPSSIPGFGALHASDDVRRLVSQAMGGLAEAPPPADLLSEEQNSSRASATEEARESQPAATAAEAGGTRPETDKADEPNTLEDAASQHPEPTSDSGCASRRKGHGTAMPR
jgi:Protein of unknown function (DUF3306)